MDKPKIIFNTGYFAAWAVIILSVIGSCYIIVKTIQWAIKLLWNCK